MLPPINRLKRKADFEEVLRHGRSKGMPLFFVRWACRHSSPPRFGFIVSNKISKKAVRRNLVKRRLREAVRATIEKFPSGCDYILISKQPIVKASYADIELDVKSYLSLYDRTTARPHHPRIPNTPLPRP